MTDDKTARDEADRLRDGDLSPDPLAGTVPIGPAVAQKGVANVRTLPGQPCDLGAERALLGALLWAGANAPDSARVTSVLDILETGATFFGSGHGVVFDAMRACVAAKAEHDPVAVHSELVRVGESGAAGGLDGLLKLKGEASTLSEHQLRVYAKSIRDTWVKRELVRDARAFALDIADPKMTDDAVLARSIALSTALSARATVTAGSVTSNQSAVVLFQFLQSGTDTSMSTGLAGLDGKLNGGLRPGEVTILAARTSVGKSTLSAQIAEHIVTSDPKRGALYVTLEMAHENFMARLLAARTGVSMSNLRRRILNPSQWSDISAAVQVLAKKNLSFADSSSQTMASVYGAALERKRILEREGNRLSLVVVDHVGLVKPSAEALKKANREQQVAETSRSLRFIASELGVHVIGIAQIGRIAELHGDSMPKLHHLRETGSLENDADVVLILHRERDPKTGLFVTTKPPALAVAKARMDEIGIMLLEYEPSRARFSDYMGEETFGKAYGL
jgi:replicative DNA helicase